MSADIIKLQRKTDPSTEALIESATDATAPDEGGVGSFLVKVFSEYCDLSSDFIRDESDQLTFKETDFENWGTEMEEDKDLKYIEQRFENLDQKLDLKMENILTRFDSLSESISGNVERITEKVNDNSEWFRSTASLLSDETRSQRELVHNIESRIDSIKWWFIGTAAALLVGIGGLIFMLVQLQAGWMQQYLDVAIKTFQGG